jgi:hypothetical protein
MPKRAATPKADMAKRIDETDAKVTTHEVLLEKYTSLTGVIDTRVTTHEAICAERHSATLARIKRLENIVMSTAGMIILLLLGMVYRG